MKNMLQIIKWIEQNQSLIINEWMDDPFLTNTLKQHKVNKQNFSKKFAKGILSHALSVMRNEKEMQSCPVMDSFVTYMIKHEITSQEIVNICTPLSATIIFHLFKNYASFFNDPTAVEKILKIFNTNLSGVLHNYDRQHIKQQQKDQQKSLTIKTYLNRLQLILNAQDNMIFKIHDNKLFVGNKAFYHSLGVKDFTSFNNKYPNPLSFLRGANFYNDLLQNKQYEEWIQLIINEHQGRCKVKIFNNLLKQISTMNIKITKVAEENHYIFTLQNDLINVDPLTSVNNLIGFETLLEKKLQESSIENLKLLMIELHGLTLFHEQNSKEESEKILKEIAARLQAQYDKEVSRIDYDRFVILNDDLSLEKSNQLVNELNAIISLVPNSETVTINAAIILLRDTDSTEHLIKRGELLLNYIRDNDAQNVMDDSILTKEELKRLKEEKELLSLINQYKQKEQTVSITNFYDEIPLQSDAKIINVIGKTVTLQVKKVSAVSLKENDSVYLSMPNANYKAKLKSVDIAKEQISINKFEILTYSKLDRKNIQVKLQKPIEVLIKSGRIQILEELESISVDTFNVMMHHLYNIKEDTQLTLFATLREKEETFKGSVYKIVPIEDKFKVIIRLDKDQNKEERLLSPFVSQRQLEIIQELHNKSS